MALKLSVENPYNGTADNAYWKVVDLNCNWLNKNCHVSLCAWVDQQARTDLKQPIAQRSFDWSGDRFDFDVEENLVAQVYAKIKSEVTTDQDGNITQGEFADAEDC
jgi:hypothetical protein